ncbi:MAG: hypothetical protein KJ732_03255 [Candidatus Margulisbacteria bacterium]|nr:hypothetical protein [Candidatus Margulisiibacteriota bacterium]
MKKILGVLIIISLFANSALAIYAPRAMGMGGAFTAIADDAFAAYWNPAGFAINPGVDLAGSYQLTNRNTLIGDNTFALKGCFEIGMNPFAWVAGIGLATMFAYEGAKYLSDKDIVKKNWGRPGEKVAKEESMAEDVKAEDEKQKAEGKEPVREPISRKAIAKKAVKESGKAAIHVGSKFAEAALREVTIQTRPYYYAPHWYRPNYYRPTYWDDRYVYKEKELTPAGKAQFAMGITVMSDQNAILDQDTNWYSLSFASGYSEVVALGGNINVYDLKIPSLNVKGVGAGLDIGGLVRISDSLMFGLAVKELLTTDIKFENGTIKRYQMSVNGGIAIKPIKQATLAMDVHNMFEQNNQAASMHYGLEVRPIYGVALRAGLSDTAQARQNKTAGISVGVGQMIIDYTYLGGAYNRTQMVGATWKI